jgi:hypothetical protein
MEAVMKPSSTILRVLIILAMLWGNLSLVAQTSALEDATANDPSGRYAVPRAQAAPFTEDGTRISYHAQTGKIASADIEPTPPSRQSMPVQPPVEGPRIRLAAGEFDPLVESEPAPPSGSLRLLTYPGDGTGYYLVQFLGPITASDMDALATAGAQVFDYIPDFTFIVKMNNTTRATIERAGRVRWVGLYQPAYRLTSDLLARVLDSASAEIVVTIFRGEELAPIITQIKDLGGAILDQDQTEWKSKLKVSISTSRLTDLAAIPGVRWIEPAPQWTLFNSVAADIMGVREVWNTHGLYGNGQTIAVCDTGLDQGSTSPAFLHDDFENGSGVSRVTAIYDRVGDGASDVNSGHGTHVAGSVLGNGGLSGATPSTHSYPSTAYVGMAPEANLVFQAVENNSTGELSGIPLDLNTLFAQAASGGAALHTNSWGSSAAGMYTSESEDVDEYVWNHKDFTILFSAGNAGVDSNADGVIDLYSMGDPGTAKNCITVGATENNRPSGSTPTPGYDFAWGTGSWATLFPASPISTDHVSNNPGGMAAFSSRGPTLDGRYKPDIVAPGTNIASTRSSLISGNGWGPIDANYMFFGGTSMSTPLTAGAAAIVRQYYTDREAITPSAALIKATLINGATDINPGQYGTGTTREIPGARPTNVAGWGRVNIQSSIFPTSPRTLLYQDAITGLNTSQLNTYFYTVTSSAEPLRVTLAWSDYPGSPAAAGGLVNDLDLQIVGPTGTTYYPNNANQRGPTQNLFYDDGIPYYAYSLNANTRAAVRFTPTSYPVTVDRGLVYVYAPSYPTSFLLGVWDDDGSGGNPGTQVFSTSVTARESGWMAIPVTSVTISSGSFYLGMQFTTTGSPLAITDANSTNARSWYYNGTTWMLWSAATGSDRDLSIRAIVKGNDYSTQADRVNNVEGIDIASPATGIYTVTVSGYNVPHGPQPYALVASGAITNVLPSVQFSTAAYSVNESAGTATITATLSAASGLTVTVSYATSNGTGIAGSDYVTASGTLTFSPSLLTQTFAVPITNDSLDESDETVVLTLSNPVNATLGAPNPATLTIVDDDGQPTVQFSAMAYSVDENGGAATITATLSAASGLTVTVNYATSNGTTLAGSDYVTASGTLTFSPGLLTRTFAVPITDDSLDESDETVVLTLSNPVNAALGAPNPATLTIVDDDGQPTVQFSTAAYSVDESAGMATITATLSTASGLTVTVNYATSNGTALAGSDYVTASGTLTFSPGLLTRTFAVPITDDSLDESDETVVLTLSNPVNAALGAPNPATLTIVDDDGQPAVRGVTLAPSTAAQSGSPGTTVTYTLRLTNTGSAIDTFTVTVSDNSWTTSTPATIGPLPAGAGSSVTITVQIYISAPGGESDIATITAASQGDSTKSAIARLTTTALYRVALPIVLR